MRQSFHPLRHKSDPRYQGVRGRKLKRVINKRGERNVEFVNIPERASRYFRDVVTTIVDAQWRYALTVFSLSFFLSWMFFAICFYLVAYTHGDLNFDLVTGDRINDGPACVENCKSIAAFLLFSIESQMTIGYGSRYPTEECPEAVFLVLAQAIVGALIEGAMAGIVYAKMTKAPNSVLDQSFSKKAVICQRNSKLCLIFRICDIKQSHVIDTKIEAYWFAERLYDYYAEFCSKSLEGEKLKNIQHKLKLENDGNIFLIFPTTVCHVIDETSPLYDLSARDLLEKKFELLVTLTGSSLRTGKMTECRTSYLPKEILWGHRFVNMIFYNRTDNVYEVDYDKLDETIEFNTPLISARKLHVVIDKSQKLSGSDESVTYYNENLNYIGHSVTQNYEPLSIIEPIPGTSGLIRSQSEQYTIRLQNDYNERNANKQQNELTSTFSQLSLINSKAAN